MMAMNFRKMFVKPKLPLFSNYVLNNYTIRSPLVSHIYMRQFSTGAKLDFVPFEKNKAHKVPPKCEFPAL